MASFFKCHVTPMQVVRAREGSGIQETRQTSTDAAATFEVWRHL
jgi:hypothetical protein